MLLRIGHRGARGHAPENTLAGIERAIECHAHMVEFDVRRTRDGRLVALHDSTVDRTTDGHGLLATLTLEELKRLDAGQGQQAPTLDEMLRAASGRIGVMIELKEEGTAEEAHRVVEISAFSGPVVYASFLHDELVTIRRKDAQSQTLALLAGVPINRTAFATDAHATHAGIAFETLTPSFLGALKRTGLRVFVYTVNEPGEIRVARALSVDGIISDFPERLV